MKEEGLVERKFVASLQRALEEVAPEHLEVFEKWFRPADRRPRYHIAPVVGALGYLRKRPDLYDVLMERAGRYASQWSCAELPSYKRRMVKARLPIGRDPMIRHLLRSALRSIHRDGLLDTRRDGEKLVVTVANSLFCRTATSRANGPACPYYAALFAGLLECAEETCSSVVESRCRGQGDSVCQFETVQ